MLKSILESNNIAFSEVEPGIFKLDNVEFDYLEDLLLHIDFTIVYLREKQSNLVPYLVVKGIANKDKIVSLQDPLGCRLNFAIEELEPNYSNPVWML